MSTKKRILELLESNRGRRVSGEHIAKQIDVSRNAVWKSINELRNDGYKISAVTNKGYCLCDDNDILSVQGIIPFLANKKAADRIYVYPTLESTNKTAKEKAISEAKHGTAIITDFQTAGKGRYGRQFFSPSKHGIYMSLILHPAQLGFSTTTLVTAFAAVSVCEAIDAISDKMPQIKWVNDIFLDGKKICGILTEAVADYESGNVQWVVVGIGINFSTPKEEFPEDLRQIAGALFAEDTPSTTRNHLIAEIINRMTTENQLDEKEMLAKYRKRLMMLGKDILVSEAANTYEAVAVDIDDIGRLIVKTKATNEVRSLSSGEIKIQMK